MSRDFPILWPARSEAEAWRRIKVFGLHPNSGTIDLNPQARDWVEMSNCFRPVWLMLLCRKTGAIGAIKNPTIYEQQVRNLKPDEGRVIIIFEGC